MRLLALLFAAIGGFVWWHPLSSLAQSMALLTLSGAVLALREAWRRLDRAHDAAAEARRLLREARTGEVPGDGPVQHLR